MNILHVNNTDLMGRRFNGYDLLDDLAAVGIEAGQAVLRKESSDPRVVQVLAGPDDEALARAILRVERRHGLDGLLSPWGRVIGELPEFETADIIHYHLIHNGVVSLLELPRLMAKKPSVWTLHDAWALTGHCIQPATCEGWLEGCVECPYLDRPIEIDRDCAGALWAVKQRVLSEVDPDIVVASEFMRDIVARSPITSHFTRVHVVPFGVDADLFLPDAEREASRIRLGIPAGDFVVLVRAAPSDIKGLQYLIDALCMRRSSRPTTVLAVGMRGLLGELGGSYNVVELGWVDEPLVYSRTFSACDVFVMPSLAEGFGMMALEAMAAGRPVVCFAGTAPATVTHSPGCGIAVPMSDVPALREAIDRLAANPDEARRRGSLGREISLAEYGHERYVSSLVSLYESVADAR